MSRIDLIYILILILSLPYGHLIKTRGNNRPSFKKILCLLPGLTTVLLLVGLGGMVHSLIVIMGSYLLIVVKPRGYKWLNFLFVFGYLFFFRVCKHIGFTTPPTHCNAIQLLVTLRMVSIGFELHNQDQMETLKRTKLSSSFFDILTYGYCYIGLMTGPFYTYQTFTDMVYQPKSKSIKTIQPALLNLKYLVIVSVLYLYFKQAYPMEYLTSDECLKAGTLYMAFCLFGLYIWLSSRFFIGWTLAESACMFAGLGAYPVKCKSRPGMGPTVIDELPRLKDELDETEVKYDFETIRNIDILGCAFPSTIKDATRKWNMTVQWWLVHHVYKQLPFKSSAVRSMILVLVSAYWHGIHLGYYITFVTHSIYIIIETLFLQTVTPIIDKKHHHWLNFATWFVSSRYLEYVCVGFFYLELKPVLLIYQAVYFYIHVLIVFVMAITYFISKRLEKLNKKR